MIEICQKCKTKYNSETVEACPTCEVANKKLLPLAVGHFKKLVEQKKGENTTLTETRDALAHQVKGLWKMVYLLESRKKDLEEYVASLELYLKKGSDVVDDTIFNP